MFSKLKRFLSFLRSVYIEFTLDRGMIFAAALSFFGIISLIPLLLLAIGVFGYIIGSREDALQRVLYFARDYIPVGANVLEQYLIDLSRQSSLLSGLGLLGLLWIGTQVFVILQQVMSMALGATKHVGILRGRGVALILVIVAGALFMLSLVITSLITAASHYRPELWGISFDGLRIVWSFLGILVPILISTLAFTFIYRFTPTENIGTEGPVIGGLTAGLLFEIAKHAFRWYVTNIANFSLIYGSLGSVIVLVIWIYYVSVITIVGAEVASVYARRKGIPRSGER